MGAAARGEGDLLTVEQVAEFLQLNKLTVYKFIHAGDLPAVRLGRSFRVRRGDVDRFLDAHLVASPRPGRTRRVRVEPVGAGARADRRREPRQPVIVVLTENREGPAKPGEDERIREVMMSTNPLEWIIRGLH